MTRYLIVSLLGICASYAGSAHAQATPSAALLTQAMGVTADPEHGKILYLKHCTSCHGQRAWGNSVKEVPTLAGQREFYLVEQLAQFATLERNSSAMHKALSATEVNHPQALRDLASYLATAARNPKPEHGDGKSLPAGKQLYQRACAMCHGDFAQGSATEPIPALAGQHYQYLVIQLQNFAAGHRGQVEPPVIDFTAGLSSGDQQGVADYLSRISQKASKLKQGPGH